MKLHLLVNQTTRLKRGRSGGRRLPRRRLRAHASPTDRRQLALQLAQLALELRQRARHLARRLACVLAAVEGRVESAGERIGHGYLATKVGTHPTRALSAPPRVLGGQLRPCFEQYSYCV